MLLAEIPSITNFDEAYQQARNDLAPAEIALKRAEARVAKAEGERQRLLRLQGELNTASAAIRIKTTLAFERNFKRVAVGEDIEKLFADVDVLRKRQENLIKALTWVVSWPIPDAEAELATAEIESKKAYCALLEAQIVTARVGALRAAREIAAHDPGAAISFNPMPTDDGSEAHGGSWSSQQVEKITTIRGEIARMELDFRDHALRTARERETVNHDNKLFT